MNLESALNKTFSIIDASPNFKTDLISRFNTLSFDKQDILLKPGHKADAIYYMDTGIGRKYIIVRERKITTRFITTGEMFIPAGIFSKSNIVEYFGFATNSTLLELSLDAIKEIVNLHPEGNLFFAALIDVELQKSIQREHLLRLPHVNDRYDKFKELYPKIDQQVPYTIISSFLNMTNETFTRMRKGLNRS